MYILIVKIKMYAHIISVDILLSKRQGTLTLLLQIFKKLHFALLVLCLFVLYRLKAFFFPYLNQLVVQVSSVAFCFLTQSKHCKLVTKYLETCVWNKKQHLSINYLFCYLKYDIHVYSKSFHRDKRHYSIIGVRKQEKILKTYTISYILVYRNCVRISIKVRSFTVHVKIKVL